MTDAQRQPGDSIPPVPATDSPNPQQNMSVITSVAFAAASALVGWMVKQGFVTVDQTTEIVSAVAAALAGVIAVVLAVIKAKTHSVAAKIAAIQMLSHADQKEAFIALPVQSKTDIVADLPSIKKIVATPAVAASTASPKVVSEVQPIGSGPGVSVIR